MSLSSFRFSSLSSVAHLVSTRHGGVSSRPYASLNLGFGTADDEDRVAANRDLVRRELGIREGALRAARLSHGTDVAVFRRDQAGSWPEHRLPVRAGSSRLETFFDADGVVSDVPGLYFLLTFADCVPLLFFDPSKGVLGVAHAGWRGTAAGMAMQMVEALTREFGSRAADIRAAVGPSIGPCCYEVGSDVPASFARDVPAPDMRGTHLDLWGSTARQLSAAGVTHVESAGICTCCDTARFFSHRGENGRTGRFGLVAGLGA